MKKIVILLFTALLLVSISATCAFNIGVDYAISNAYHYTTTQEIPADGTDLYIQLPDGNLYTTTLFCNR